MYSVGDTFAQKRKRSRVGPVKRRLSTCAPVANFIWLITNDRSVRMKEQSVSKTARIGDSFTATVTSPFIQIRRRRYPTGSTVTGRVDSVVAAKKGGDPGQISASFVSVRLPNGSTRAINGSLTDLNTKQAKSDNEGTASGDDRKNDKAIFIGGGAGGGAILGGLIGGGKGALIGEFWALAVSPRRLPKANTRSRS